MVTEPDGVGAREHDPTTSFLEYGEWRKHKMRPQRMQQQNPDSEKLDRMDGPVSSTEKLQEKVKEMEEEPTDSKKT